MPRKLGNPERQRWLYQMNAVVTTSLSCGIFIALLGCVHRPESERNQSFVRTRREYVAQQSLPFDRIVMRKWGYWSGRSTVSFSSSGEALFEGGRLAVMEGVHTGVVSRSEYAHACLALVRLNVMSMQETYRRYGMDISSVEIELYGDGTNLLKRIREDVPAGPVELWIAQQCIDSLIPDVDWKDPRETKREQDSRETLPAPSLEQQLDEGAAWLRLELDRLNSQQPARGDGKPAPQP